MPVALVVKSRGLRFEDLRRYGGMWFGGVWWGMVGYGGVWWVIGTPHSGATPLFPWRGARLRPVSPVGAQKWGK